MLQKEFNIDMVYPSKTDDELLFLAKNQDKINAKMFLPSLKDIELFEDKWRTYQLVKEKNLCRVPTSYLIHGPDELKEKMAELSDDFKREVWIRRIYGSGGSGSIATEDYDLAKAWINRNNGWGKFTVAKKLTDKTYTWSGLWKDGNLIISQSRKRLYWEFANRSPSGVTGITGAQSAVNSSELDELSQNIIKNLSEEPNGGICVDYTMDDYGKLNLTEIQASRLYTSTFFMAKCGVNFPYLFYKLCLDKEISKEELQSKVDEKHIWLKYVETFPNLTTEEELGNYKYQLEDYLKAF